MRHRSNQFKNLRKSVFQCVQQGCQLQLPRWVMYTCPLYKSRGVGVTAFRRGTTFFWFFTMGSVFFLLFINCFILYNGNSSTFKNSNTFYFVIKLAILRNHFHIYSRSIQAQSDFTFSVRKLTFKTTFFLRELKFWFMT